MQPDDNSLDIEPKAAVGPLPATFAEAARFMTNKPFLASARYRGQQWRANRVGAHPDILAFERAFVARFRKLGIPMFAHCVLRTNAEQARHFVRGTSTARPGDSPHNHGRAVDLVHGTRAWEVPKPCWDLIGHVGLEVAARLGVEVQWGGHWAFYDPAHWELKGWRGYPDKPQVTKASLDAVLRLYDLS